MTVRRLNMWSHTRIKTDGLFPFSPTNQLTLPLSWVCLCVCVCAWTHSNGLQSLFVLVCLFHPATCDTTWQGLKVRDQRLNKYQTSRLNPVTLRDWAEAIISHISKPRLFSGGLYKCKNCCVQRRERESHHDPQSSSSLPSSPKHICPTLLLRLLCHTLRHLKEN